jgi:hypothetical protein
VRSRLARLSFGVRGIRFGPCRNPGTIPALPLFTSRSFPRDCAYNSRGCVPPLPLRRCETLSPGIEPGGACPRDGRHASANAHRRRRAAGPKCNVARLSTEPLRAFAACQHALTLDP